MSPSEIEQAVRRCDRRHRWPWLFFWGFLLMVVITNVFMNHGGVITPRALRADSQATSLAIFNALDQFHTEYDCLPMPTSGEKGRDWDTDSSAAENIVVIFKGLDPSANPKAMDFLGDIKDAKHVDGERRNGLVRDAATAALVDPWGQPYFIRMDGDRDGFVADPAHPDQRLAKTVIVWSAGKDGDPETWNDNVGSWASEF